MYAKYGKRFFDFLIALVLCVFLAPLLVVVGVLLVLTQGRPVLFRQVRPGRNAVPFEMMKFRTMRNEFARDGRVLSDAERVTSLGSFLRRSSLDELPELWNVLCGQMSLVGPRPLLVEYLPHYTPEHFRRHEVRPGITGLAQVSGRQNLLFSQRMDKDVRYVDSLSLWMDITILWLTVKRVLSKRDVIVGQEVDEVDDLGLSVDLAKPPAGAAPAQARTATSSDPT